MVYWLTNAATNLSKKCDCLSVKKCTAYPVCLFEQYKENTVLNVKDDEENIDWRVNFPVVEKLTDTTDEPAMDDVK